MSTGAILTLQTWTSAALAEMEGLGAFAVVESAPCVARINVIPKSTAGEPRIIADARRLNEALASSRLMFGGAGGDWMFSFDLQSGHCHVDVHPSHWTFLGFLSV